jgi:hypothetical protein
MNLVHRSLFAGFAGLAVVVGAAGQEKKEAPTTPAVDEIKQGFRAYIVAEPRFPADEVRNRTGKMQDLVTDHGLDPTIAVFSREIPKDVNHPLTAVVKKMDDLALNKDYKARRLGGFLVFLALPDEFRKDPPVRDTRLKEAAQFASGVMPKMTTIAVSEAAISDEGGQPLVPAQVSAMGIAPEDDIVIIFYYKFNVIKRWKFKASTPPGEAELKELDDEVAKLLAPKKK